MQNIIDFIFQEKIIGPILIIVGSAIIFRILKAIVKNIPENRQVYLANDLIDKYNPDIVVITGHDRYD